MAVDRRGVVALRAETGYCGREFIDHRLVVGDPGSRGEKHWDQAVAVTSQQAAQHIPFVPDEWADPWGGARVTDNANIGERYDVK